MHHTHRNKHKIIPWQFLWQFTNHWQAKLRSTILNRSISKIKLVTLIFLISALVISCNYKDTNKVAIATVDTNAKELVKYQVGIQGVNITQDADMSLVQDLGVGSVRFDVRWDEMENGTREINTSFYDRHFSNLAARGMRAIASLNFNNPSYGARSIFSSFTPAQVDGFARFAFATVKHYQGRKDITWEIYNEPNLPGFWPNPNPINYMELAGATSSAIRSADPEAHVFGPALGHIPPNQRPQAAPWSKEYLDFTYLQRCLEEELLPLVDKVSVHPYPGGPPESLMQTYRLLRSLLKQYPGGNSIPIAASETGYSTKGDYRVSEREQAMWLPRQILINLSQQISPTIIWSLRDMASIQNEANEFHGLVRTDGSKKPAYEAVQTLLANLGNLSFEKRIPVESGDWVLRFTNGQRSVIAAWTTGLSRTISVEGQSFFITPTPVYVPLTNP